MVHLCYCEISTSPLIAAISSSSWEAAVCGKSTLLKHLMGLLSPAKGDIFYSGESFTSAEERERNALIRKFGVMYQSGALWSSLTLAENIALPLEQYTTLSKSQNPRNRFLQTGPWSGSAASRTSTPPTSVVHEQARGPRAGHGARSGDSLLR